MNEWKCTVKTPSNWLQTVRVEAYTHSDAVAFAESQTGGKCIMAVIDNSYSSDDNEQYSGESSGINGGLVLFGLMALMLIYAWKWILLLCGISFVIWMIMMQFGDNN